MDLLAKFKDSSFRSKMGDLSSLKIFGVQPSSPRIDKCKKEYARIMEISFKSVLTSDYLQRHLQFHQSQINLFLWWIDENNRKSKGLRVLIQAIKYTFLPQQMTLMFGSSPAIKNQGFQSQQSFWTHNWERV